MTSTAFFGLDEMHLLGHGTGQQLYVALGGKFCPTINNSRRNAHGIHLQDRLKHHRYPFALDVSLEDINIAICASRANIPADFMGIIAQQWRITAANIQEAEEAIGHWHASLHCEIKEKRLKPTVFVINQHMLVHFDYMMWEMGPLQAYSCRPIKRTIGVYSVAIKSRKKPGKNMENLLLRKAEINHCLGCQPVICVTNDRRTSNFEVASNDVAGPQLWSRPTGSSLAELAAAIGIECQDLIRSLVPFWAREGIVSFEENDEVVCANKMWKDLVGFILKFFSQTVNRVTRLFATIDCFSDVQRVNQDLFPAWDSLAPGVVKVVDVKSIKGIAGLVHNPNDETIWHIIWPSPKYNQ
ncbi:hypothetical protein PHYBLDRAFT_169345 [Phycomyces blakesleeanus NRRL 1555(-)]|uniref:Uncharacterized protein n=1 Tax=Phycomyces blakesleeanus (strain ATCC 8743b / DSM 1359 / FGSC 10004 / NBRC 33097 / NRRL 1555) TaxID=763407 RepID=A0A163DS35_PHYB8|nr:hypothetical protein PHYBLDRAFT_169345 [Phycomyces blakesleeanus NRRL 1555(-)]OAD73090.1 hypothetical protein PHYBLDRAFT_169345 [Phycomyces blakesleeanus NRRL 1555(-)]|eukprot:XP_018291130.1 hypothetical protein PHYBLDRAFT_169345 [Phycomyces blakesleeanus NRRL 1555(-)]